MKFQIVFLLVLFSLFGCVGGSDENDDDESNEEDITEDLPTFTNISFEYSHTYYYVGWLGGFNESMFNFSCVVNDDIKLEEINLYVYNYSYYMDLRSVYTTYTDFDLIDNDLWEDAYAIMITSYGILHKNDTVECYFVLDNNGSYEQKIYLNQQHVFFVEISYIIESKSWHWLVKRNVTQTNLGNISVKSMPINN